MTFATDDCASDRSVVPDLPGDDVLLEAARSGSPEAFRTLRGRYLGTALAVARVRTGDAQEAEKVASAAFGRIEQIVGDGQGPHSFLGAFVVWMVGREADGGTGPIALPEDHADPAALVRAFTRLPAAWQAFLWHTEIQRWPVRRAAAALGISAVAAVPLQRDVFVGLRRAYRQMSAPAETMGGCEQCRGDLTGFVRGILPLHRRREIQQHLDECPGCTAGFLRNQDPGTGLRTWVLPVLAGLSPWGAEAADVAGMLEDGGTFGVGEQETRTSPWSGHGVKSLLGAGALVTAVAVTSVGLSALGDPAPGPDRVAAEQAPGSAEDAGAVAAGPVAGAETEDGPSEDERSAAQNVSRGPDRHTTDQAQDGIHGSPADAPESESPVALPAAREPVLSTGRGDDAAAGVAPVLVLADKPAEAERTDGTDWGRDRPAAVPSVPATEAADTAPHRSDDADSRTEGPGATGRPPASGSATAPPPLSATREEAIPSPMPSVRGSWPVVLIEPAPSQAPTPAARTSYPPSTTAPTRDGSGGEGRWRTSTSHSPEAERGGRAEPHRGGGWNGGRGGETHHDRRGETGRAGEVERNDRWHDHRFDSKDGWAPRRH